MKKYFSGKKINTLRLSKEVRKRKEERKQARNISGRKLYLQSLLYALYPFSPKMLHVRDTVNEHIHEFHTAKRDGLTSCTLDLKKGV